MAAQGDLFQYASLTTGGGFHYYMSFIKFGIGRCTSDAARNCDGHITREGRGTRAS